jgi:hypothetical protein
MSSIQETSGSYVYQGCYNDQSSRAIPTQVSSVTSVDACANQAQSKNATVFGVQNGSQCFVGTSLDSAFKYGANSGNCGTLGGSWTNQVYALSSSSSSTAPLILQYDFKSNNVSGSTLKNSVSSSNYTGTLVNIPGMNVAASPQTAIMFSSFNSSNQNYIKFSNFATTNNGLTFSFWFMANSNNQTWSRIFDFGNGAPSNNIVCYINSGYLGFCVYNGSSSYLNNVVPNVCTNSLIHIAWVLTYPNGWDIYVNGHLYNTQAGWYPPVVTRNNCYIAKSNWSSDPYFTGYIGDFRVYNGVLSTSDITNIYQNGIVPPLPSLFIQYNFSSAYVSGTTVKNVVSSNYSATLMNGTQTNVNQSTTTNVMFASFNTSSKNYIKVPSHATTNSGLTYCFWAIVSSSNATYNRIFDFGNGGPSNNIIASINNGYLEFSLYNNTSVYYNNAIPNFTNNSLYHVAWTLTYPQGWKVYVNGSLYSTISGGWYPPSLTRNSCLLGTDNWGGSSHLQGYIGDFRIYNGVLDGNQISSIYQAALLPPIPQLSSPNFATETFVSQNDSNCKKCTKMIIVLLILIIIIYIIFSMCKK